MKVFSFLFVFFPLSFAFAQAQQDTLIKLSEVEIKAERIFKKEAAGMKITEVDTLIIDEKINLSLSELLSENTPVFIKSHGRGALATASFRGTGASHTQVSWNGMNINSPMTGMVDFSLIPVYIIDDLNLKHGAASIFDQSGGLGGSINILNKVDWNQTFNLKYLQGIGSYQTFDEFLKIGGGNKSFQFNTRVYHNYSKNDYTFINRGIGNIDPVTEEITNPLDTNHNADFTKYGMLQEIYYRPNLYNIISGKYWGQWADRTIPRVTSYEGPDNSNLNDQNNTDHKAILNWKHFMENSKFTLQSGYADKQLIYTLNNQVPGLGLIPAVYSKSTQQSSLNKASYVYNINDQFSLDHSLSFNFHDVSSTDTVKKTGFKQQRKELDAFFAVRKSFNDRVNLNLAFRQSWVDGKSMPFVPFLGLDYRLFKEIDLILKGNIARNFHQPTLNDLYWQPGGNPNLLSEEGISGEIGLEYQKTRKTYTIKTELTTYRSDINNWIIWIPSFKGYWEPRNIKRVLSQGIEWGLSLKGHVKKIKYQITGNYAYTSSINYGDPITWGDESYGKQLVYVPLHSGNLLIHLNYKEFYATYQHNSYSERFTTTSNDVTRRDWLYPYFMNDFILGKNWKYKKLRISAEFKIYNLFNEIYHSILYRPMPRRNYVFLVMVNI